MAATQLNPLEHEETFVAPVPPPTHPLSVEECFEAWFSNLTLDDKGPPVGEHKVVNNPPPPEHIGDPFSLSGLSPLQTFIPDDLFPDTLLVHDPDYLAGGGRSGSPDFPLCYVRVFPNFKASRGPHPSDQQLFFPSLRETYECYLPPDPAFLSWSPADPVHAAHLYLTAANRVGEGHHSSVFSAPLRLRLDPRSGAESTVRVAAKTAHGTCGAHMMLNVEANVYNAFPRHLMDDGGGMAQPAPFGHPYAGTGSEHPATAGSVEPAVVPKFYGCYVPVGTDKRAIMPLHTRCGPDGSCPVPNWPSRILLIEECGQPILPGPAALAEEQKLHCLQLVKRLHAAGFVQNSMYHRNILVQPGPLRAPPAARSYATPSFRIVDFGRGLALAHLPPPVQPGFWDACEMEQWRAVYRVLKLHRAAEGAEANAEAAGVEQWMQLKTEMCEAYALLVSISQHSSHLGDQVIDVLTRG